MPSEFEIAERAKELFITEHPDDRRWGNNLPDGVSFEMDVGSLRPPMLTDRERQRYLKRAREELKV